MFPQNTKKILDDAAIPYEIINEEGGVFKIDMEQLTPAQREVVTTLTQSAMN